MHRETKSSAHGLKPVAIQHGILPSQVLKRFPYYSLMMRFMISVPEVVTFTMYTPAFKSATEMVD